MFTFTVGDGKEITVSLEEFARISDQFHLRDQGKISTITFIDINGIWYKL
ncbi:hypothetical protein V5R04_01475 [Jonesiaceae bacterium BS-20]|uniref:Uncharacterized protein n=1 Tax=Jonesiaceae bacterium BS-20 TaxID=3120821 RepID=A0AAU7DW30_9MICO